VSHHRSHGGIRHVVRAYRYPVHRCGSVRMAPAGCGLRPVHGGESVAAALVGRVRRHGALLLGAVSMLHLARDCPLPVVLHRHHRPLRHVLYTWSGAVHDDSSDLLKTVSKPKMLRVLTIVLSAMAVACSSARVAAPKPDRTAAVRLAAADASVRAGCFDCLLEAHDEYLALRRIDAVAEA